MTGSTILLVEDNEDDVFAFNRALKKAAVANKVDLATDGRNAVEYLERSRHDLPFIVFLDLKLPYMNGFEILTWLRRQRCFDDVVVVVLTSSAETKDQQQAYTLGARTYLVKPPSPKDIRDVMFSLEAYWAGKGIAGPQFGA